jgi:hypothetical protein
MALDCGTTRRNPKKGIGSPGNTCHAQGFVLVGLSYVSMSRDTARSSQHISLDAGSGRATNHCKQGFSTFDKKD